VAEQTEIPVLIVGAGPVGLMMAAELVRHGVKCRIVDKSPAPTTQSRALALHARTLEIFDLIGIADEVIGAGHIVHGMSAFSGGRRIVHLSFDEIDSRHCYALMLPQSETERIIIQHLKTQGLEVERNLELTGLAQDDDGVSAILRPTAGGDPVRCHSNWLIGCDGAHSGVRNQLGLGFEGKQYEEAFWLADVLLDSSEHDDEISVHVAANSIVALFPMGNSRWRIIAGGDFAADAVDPTLAQIQAQLDNSGIRGSRAHDPYWLAHFRISRRRVEKYDFGRVFLAGDSAHIHSPAGGQGMNTGLQDAFNLAWKLALVNAGAARPDLLASYNAERYPVSAEVLRETDLMTRAVTLRQPVAQAIRDRLIPILSATEVVQQRVGRTIAELAVNYRHSPIVGEHRSGLAENLRAAGGAGAVAWYDFGQGPAAGDRAPDAEPIATATGGAHRLYEALRGTRFNLLLFSGIESAGDYSDLARFSAAVRERFGDRVKSHLILSRGENAELPGLNTVRDTAHEMHRVYGAGARCLYLIRPDGYVGFRAQPPDAPSLIKNLGLTLK